MCRFKPQTLKIIGGAAFLLWFFTKGAKSVSGSIGGAVDLVTGISVGVVTGIGDAVGLPRVEVNACQLAKDSNDISGASLHGSAGDFLDWTFNKNKTGTLVVYAKLW